MRGGEGGELPTVTWEERDEMRLWFECLLGDLLLRERDGARERRLCKRDCDEEDTLPSLSDRWQRLPKPLHSSLRIRSLIRLA